MKKKLLLAIIALVVLAVLGGGGFFAFRMLSAKKAAAPPPPVAVQEAAPGADDDEDAAPAGGEGAAPAVSVLQLTRLIVNLGGARPNAFLKCDIHILIRDAELGKQATSDKPTPENSVIRSIVLDALSGKTVEEASDTETRESIRQEIKDKLNDRFAGRMRTPEALAQAAKTGKAPRPPIKDVLVVDWAIQQ